MALRRFRKQHHDERCYAAYGRLDSATAPFGANDATACSPASDVSASSRRKNGNGRHNKGGRSSKEGSLTSEE
ncbi:hypothetical protein PHSY_004856 [Pseudozyma hubeiensis SY62]|uniref:Uncharacterized protein n=1 Tax=Pseudozyma hubeiensis (strain SY62) TaxID=1305764 RepID=R9P7E4_PSEHS|nr:hypothetical protein PHSY_004856 [Pseudozyma hubeiensis SY62]GAC97271.1 hypothetical protein PHSY_004856 [Pseudozyma hubeiensis SY62]